MIYTISGRKPHALNKGRAMKKISLIIVILWTAFFSNSVIAATFGATGYWDYSAPSHYNEYEEPNPSTNGVSSPGPNR